MKRRGRYGLRSAVRQYMQEAGEPVSVTQLAEALSVTRETIHTCFRLWRQAEGRPFYVADWRRAPGNTYPAPLYMLGNKPDVPRPQRANASERNRRYRQKLGAVLRVRRAAKRGPVNPFLQLMP